MTVLLVVLGGALGAPSRWLVDQWVQQRRPAPFPWGTFVVNMSGAFALGVLLGAASEGGPGQAWVALLGIGFCGSFTTFSTFGFEAVRLAEEGRSPVATGYVVGSVVVGVGLACVGWALGAMLA